MGGTVICCVDDSVEAIAAGQTAAVVAARLSLRLVLAHVTDEEGNGEPESPRRVLENIPASLCEHISTELRVLEGEPAQKLAELAIDEGADLLVLGARLTGVRRQRLECTLSRELEAACDTPVVLVPV